jgi:hypothetical protein
MTRRTVAITVAYSRFDRHSASGGTRKKISDRKITPSDSATASRAAAKRSDRNDATPYAPTATSETCNASANVTNCAIRVWIGATAMPIWCARTIQPISTDAISNTASTRPSSRTA